MKLTFLGTRANIEASSRRHRRHSSLLVSYRGHRLRIDCGEDWAGRAGEGDPDAIVLTHAHPDHAFGLRQGAPCPVYATRETWARIGDFPIGVRRTLRPGKARRIRGITVEAFPVEHALVAPAVGLRIAAGRALVVYAPDVLAIPRAAEALRGAGIYIGDGSSLERPIVRRSRGVLVGHASIRDQVGWCEAQGVPRALFTHCGSQIVAGRRRAEARVRRLGTAARVDARIAHDGLEVTVR